MTGRPPPHKIKAGNCRRGKTNRRKRRKRPHLAAILVGHDGGSETYVRNKVLACEACGFKSTLLRFEDTISEEELLAEVDKLNKDEDVDGFIVQLPLPRHISEQKVIEAIDFPQGRGRFPPHQRGKNGYRASLLHLSHPERHPGTAPALPCRDERQEMRHPGPQQHRRQTYGTAYDAKQYGDATVTVCHSRSRDLKKECREADIIIAAIGQPDFVTADMVKEGATVIDVGTTRVPDATKKKTDSASMAM